MFMVAMGIALVGYTLYPTAPPRFFPEWGFVDTVADFTGVKHDSSTVNALFNPYAAVPSMHVVLRADDRLPARAPGQAPRRRGLLGAATRCS